MSADRSAILNRMQLSAVSTKSGVRDAGARATNSSATLPSVIVIGMGILIGWNSLLTASDTDAKSSSVPKDASRSLKAQAKDATQKSSAAAASQSSAEKKSKPKPQPKPEDVAAAITKIDRSLKDAEGAKAKSDWGTAFRATVKAWEVARVHRDDVKIKPKLKSIEVELEELGQKANKQYEAKIKSLDVIHVDK